MAKNTPEGDIVYGGRRIAEFLGIEKRTVYHLVATKRLPHWCEGKALLARRSTLKAWAAEREAAAKASGRFTVAGRKRNTTSG